MKPLQMNNPKFNGAAALAEIHMEREKRKKVKLLRPSKLNAFRGEIFELRKQGGSYADITYWLETKKGCPTNKTTVMRFLKNNAPQNTKS